MEEFKKGDRVKAINRVGYIEKDKTGTILDSCSEKRWWVQWDAPYFDDGIWAINEVNIIKIDM